MAYLRDPAEITRRSFAQIRDEVDLSSLPPAIEPLAVRLIHASGMTDIVGDLAFSDGAAEAGVRALAAGRPVLADCNAVVVMISRPRLKARNPVVCTLDDPAVPERARAAGTTRSAAAVDLWRARLGGAVVAIGNAPTALFRLLEILDEGASSPALVLGFPVGFVGAAESKEALIARRDVPFVALRGRRGGSAMAAAAVNALAGDA